LNISISTLV